MPINDDFKHQVKMANPLDSVISRYVTLKRSGKNFMACCPFHSEKTPSFHVNTTEGFYKCFGCGESGDVFSFIMKIENLTFIEALRFLAERAGISMPKFDKSSYNDKNSKDKTTMYAINREANIFFYEQLKKYPQAKDYIKNVRRFSGEVALKTYRMGYAPKNWWELINYLHKMGYSDDDILKSGLAKKNDKGAIFSFFRDRIVVPILDSRGNVIAFGGRLITNDSKLPKYLNSPDSPVFKKSENLFSLNIAKKNILQDKTILLAEGYMDVIALYQAGFKNSVATLGTSLTPEQVNIIKRYADNVIICYDNDKAGISATNRAIGLFLNSPNTKDITIKILRIDGAKDPDEYIKNYGSEKFKLMLDKSIDAIDFQISQIRNSLNLSTNSGKIDMLKHCAQVLSQIQNKTSREVYISSIARECNIEPSVFSQAVSDIIQNNSNHSYRPVNIQNNYQPQIIEDINQSRQQINQYNYQYYAERQIIACISIFRDIDFIQYVRDTSIINHFKLYTQILITIFNNLDNICKYDDITIIHSNLSESEYSELCNIINDNVDVITYDTVQQTLEECIKTIISITNMEKINSNKNESNYLNQLQIAMRNKFNITK